MKEIYFSAYRRNVTPTGEPRTPEHLAYIDEPAKGLASSMASILGMCVILLSMLVW